MKKVIFIPVKLPEYKKLRVAAYCRVSTLIRFKETALHGK